MTLQGRYFIWCYWGGFKYRLSQLIYILSFILIINNMRVI